MSQLLFFIQLTCSKVKLFGGIILLLDFRSLDVKKLNVKLIDFWIVIPYILLLGIGVVMVYSASFYNNMMVGGSTTQYLVKQAIFAVIGMVLCFLGYMLKTSILKSRGVITILAGITIPALLYLVFKGILVPSSKVNGASAWVNLGLFNYQPLEMAKVFFVMYLALVLSNKRKVLMDVTFKEMLRTNVQQIVILGGTIFLVLIQPDIGGAMVLTLISIVMISASTIPSKLIISMDVSLVAVVGMIVTFLFTFKPGHFAQSYQYQRFLAMQNPFALERGAGAQLVNSFYAISNGGLFGVGLGNSIQKRGYLPEPHTDFILAIISEELGVVGVVIVLLLLATIVLRMLLVGIRSQNVYTSLVMYGVATMMMTQIFLNVGGLLGIIPLTGVTLPFISYGGSSMMILSLALGIVLNLEAEEKYDSIKLR